MTISVDRSGDQTSSNLILSAKKRVPAAWQTIHQTYGPLVYTWCRERGISEDDAVDISQEVFRAVVRNLDNFEHRRLGREELSCKSGDVSEASSEVTGASATQGGSFRRWLFVITRNKIRDFWRQRLNGPRAIGGTDVQQALHQVPFDLEGDSTSDDSQQELLTRRVLQLIQTEFEERTWSAFWLVTVEGQSIARVADELEMTTGAVRQAKYRVLRRLREELGTVE